MSGDIIGAVHQPCPGPSRTNPYPNTGLKSIFRTVKICVSSMATAAPILLEPFAINAVGAHETILN